MAHWRVLSVTLLLVVAACAPAAAPLAPTAAPVAAPTVAATSGVKTAYTPPPPLSPPVHVKVIDGGIVSNISFYEGIDKGYFAKVDLAPYLDSALVNAALERLGRE